MITYIITGALVGFLISLLLIRHREFERYCENKLYLGTPIATMTKVSVEVMVMIVSGLITLFGTIDYWTHKRLSELEDTVQDLKTIVTGNDDDVNIIGQDERIRDMQEQMDRMEEKIDKAVKD